MSNDNFSDLQYFIRYLQEQIEASRKLTLQYTIRIPSMTEHQLTLLLKYAELLQQWNQKMDLIAPSSTSEIICNHLVDSVIVQSIVINEIALADGISYLDIGSGAGLPGVILAILEPTRQVMLCEPRYKRAIFLSEVKKWLELANIVVVNDRIENRIITSQPSLDGRIGLCLSRALGNDDIFFSAAERLLISRGYAVIITGNTASEERCRYNSPTVRFNKRVQYYLNNDNRGRAVLIWERFT